MKLQMNEQQLLIQRSARKFLTENCPAELVRAALYDPAGQTRKLWRGMADLGWMGLVIPERFGGSGAGFVEMFALLEEMGRACLPGPFFSTAVLGALCLTDIADEQQQREFLPRIASGELTLTVALQEQGHEFNEQAVCLQARSLKKGYLLRGAKLFVPDVNLVDFLVCSARIVTGDQVDAGLTLFILPRENAGLEFSPLDSIGGIKLYEVIFNGVEVSPDSVIGKPGRIWPQLRQVMHKAAAAKSVEMVGGGQAVLDIAVSYAREREQFGRPIGSFQAIQHHCVNMLMDLESARWLAYKCAWRIDSNEFTLEQAAMAKAWCNQAYRRIVQLGHQVMGGIGYCEDHSLPLYFRNARIAEILLGDSDTHLETVAEALLGVSASAEILTETDRPAQASRQAQ